MSQLSFPRISAVAILAVALSGCHSGGGDEDGNGGSGGATTTFTVGGNVTGLTQGSVVLRLNGANDLTVNATASGAVAFTFAGGGLANGASYTVTIAIQPNGAAPPVSVICGPSLTNGTGTISGANVTNVALACASYTLGGTVSGLKQGSSVELQINALDGKVHMIATNGAFTFPSHISAGIGAAYTIGIKQQPTGQTCLITGALGILTAAAPSATSTQVSCYDNVTDPLSGTYQVTHVDGAVLDDVRDFLTFYPDGSFLFGLHEAGNPECGPNGDGGVEYGVYNWDDVSHDFRVVHLLKLANQLECGLDETTVGKLVIRGDGTLLFADNEGTATLTPVPSTSGELIGSWGGPQSFTVLFADGTFFSADTRAFGQGSNTFPGIEDGCYTLVGTRASGTYTTNLSANCAVSSTQTAVDTTGPIGLSQWTTTARTFTVTGDTLQIALVPAAPTLLVPVQRILVSPTTPSTFRVSGTITGLTGTTGVTLRLNGQSAAGFNAFQAAGSTSFAFDAQLQSGATYAVGIPLTAQPTNPTQFCRPTAGGVGTIVANDITNVAITCTNSSGYTVTGTVSGLAGGAQLTLQALYFDVTVGSEGDFVRLDVPVSANGQYAPIEVPANAGVFLGILTPPAGQSCTLTRASSFSLGPAITNVNLTCADNVPGGLSGTYTLLDGEGRDYVNFNADGTVTTVFIHRDPDPANQSPPADCQIGVPAIDERNGNGVENGLFSWNPTTRETQLLPNPPIDTNGDCGFWEPGVAPSMPWAILTRVGNTLVLESPPGDDDPFSATASAVESVAGSIVGAWVPEANNGSLLVFHADGTYMYAETQLAGLYPAGLGQERGCYTVSTPDSTITLTVAATCRPDGFAAYDLNSFAGAFTPGTTITTVGPVPLTLVDANTLKYVGRTYKRTVPN
jgi:hypothetical protein